MDTTFTTPLRLVKTAPACLDILQACSRFDLYSPQPFRRPAPCNGIARAQEPRSPVQDLHTLVHVKTFADLEAKVDALDPQDPNWKAILELLVEGGEQQGAYEYLKRKAKRVLDTNKDIETRATAAFALATGYWRSGQLSEAKAAFGEVAKILPRLGPCTNSNWECSRNQQSRYRTRITHVRCCDHHR